MARKYSLENPIPIVPERGGYCKKGWKRSIDLACREFMVKSGMRAGGMADVIRGDALEGLARKRMRQRS